MTETYDTNIDELGPVDYLVVAFPPGQQNFTGEMAEELGRLSESEQIRLLDILLLTKDADGTVTALGMDDLENVDEIRALSASLAEILAAEDLARLAEAMPPGTVAGAVIWENRWAAPFASAARRAGGQLVSSGRIPVQGIVASIQAQMAAEAIEADSD